MLYWSIMFLLFALVSWIYQYRNADQQVIALEDEGFAEVELKELKMEEPPPEPEKLPEPVVVMTMSPTQNPSKLVPAPIGNPSSVWSTSAGGAVTQVAPPRSTRSTTSSRG